MAGDEILQKCLAIPVRLKPGLVVGQCLPGLLYLSGELPLGAVKLFVAGSQILPPSLKRCQRAFRRGNLFLHLPDGSPGSLQLVPAGFNRPQSGLSQSLLPLCCLLCLPVIDSLAVVLTAKLGQLPFRRRSVVPGASRSLFVPGQLGGELFSFRKRRCLLLLRRSQGLPGCLHLLPTGGHCCRGRCCLRLNVGPTSPQRIAPGLSRRRSLAAKRQLMTSGRQVWLNLLLVPTQCLQLLASRGLLRFGCCHPAGRLSLCCHQLLQGRRHLDQIRSCRCEAERLQPVSHSPPAAGPRGLCLHRIESR